MAAASENALAASEEQKEQTATQPLNDRPEGRMATTPSPEKDLAKDITSAATGAGHPRKEGRIDLATEGRAKGDKQNSTSAMGEAPNNYSFIMP